VYESIGRDHYVLRWLHENRIDWFAFDGEALHPVAQSPDGPIQFELVAHGASTLWLLDPSTGKVVVSSDPAAGDAARPASSPDGKWLAFTVQRGGSKQLWLQPTDGSRATALTGGACNSFSPAWELDSRAIVFASDCDRGLGLPALYRARIY
jgi:Tol biopolymer transport system component